MCVCVRQAENYHTARLTQHKQTHHHFDGLAVGVDSGDRPICERFACDFHRWPKKVQLAANHPGWCVSLLWVFRTEWTYIGLHFCCVWCSKFMQMTYFLCSQSEFDMAVHSPNLFYQISCSAKESTISDPWLAVRGPKWKCSYMSYMWENGLSCSEAGRHWAIPVMRITKKQHRCTARTSAVMNWQMEHL